MPVKKYSRSIKAEGGDMVVFSEKPFDVINETPLENRLVLLEDAAPSIRASGIILEGAAAIKPYTGVVLAAGPECHTVKPGDKVRYAVRAGEKVVINEQDYLMLKETDLYTILNK